MGQIPQNNQKQLKKMDKHLIVNMISYKLRHPDACEVKNQLS